MPYAVCYCYNVVKKMAITRLLTQQEEVSITAFDLCSINENLHKVQPLNVFKQQRQWFN